MTLPASYSPTSAAADGATTNFTFNFPAISTTFIKVYSQNLTTGALTPITTGFTVTENATKTGGTVAFSVAPDDCNIIIERETPQSQPQPLSTSKGFPAKVLEQMFDKVVAMIQERFEELSRSLSYPLGTSTSVSAEIPKPISGKGIKGNSTSDGWIATTYDPDEQVALATAQAVIATTQASAAQTAKGLAEDARDEAIEAAAQFTKATQAQAEAGTDDTTYMTPLRTKQAITALGYKYVDRGDLSVYHFTIADLIHDGNWHDLDLSALSAIGAKRVKILVGILDSSVGVYFFTRKNGNINSINKQGVKTVVSGQETFGYIDIELDENRVIEYAMSNATGITACNIAVLGYYI